MHARRLILPVLATALGALAFSATPALAGEVHVYSHSFGEAGHEAGQFEDPSDLAVNTSTGDVYVADKGNNRIDEFDSSGTFIQAWGWGVADGLPMFETCTLSCQAGIAGSGKGQLDEPEQIAVDNSGKSVAEDPSTGDVYVTDRGDNVIDKFSASGASVGQMTTGAGGVVFGALDGVAVDPKGLVWVSQSSGSGQVDSYSDALANEFLSSSEEGVYDCGCIGLEGGGPIPGFAVDSEDHLYVAYGRGGISDGVARLNSEQELVPGSGEENNENVPSNFKGIRIGAHQHGEGSGVKTGVAVDFSNDSVFLDMNGEEVGPSGQPRDPVWDVEELAADGSLTETFGSEQLADRGGSGLAVNSSTGTVYVSDDVAGAVFVYTTVPTPSVLTGAASDLHTEGAATLNGTVDPEGIALEECRFEYFSEKAFAENLKNEVQSVTVSAGATGGDFTLTFKGEATPPLPEDAFAGEIRFYLETFASIGAGNVAVTGSAGAYTIEFEGALAHTKLPALVAESYAGKPLEPTGASVTAAIVTLGGDGYEAAATAPCVPTVIPTGSGAVPVTAPVSGLTPDTLYKYRLEARNHNGVAKGEYRVFVAPARPGVAGEALSGVGSSVATLSAQIDPGGAPTGYRVEYGTSEAYGSSTPEVSAGAGSTPAAVQISLSGLLPGTVYHARIVASNVVAVVQGAPLTFTTSGAAPASASVLPDDRAYELVSNFPVGQDEEAHVPASGERAFGGFEHGLATPLPFQVAPGGEAVAYSGDAAPTGGIYGQDEGNEYLATRTSGGSWTQADIEPSGPKAKYWAFSSDLSVGILLSSQSALGGGSGENVDYYAHATVGGGGGEYAPLYTGTPPNRLSDEFGAVGWGGVRADDGGAGPPYDGMNAGTSAVPAASHLLFEADDALLAGEGALEKELDAGVKQEIVEHKEGTYLYDSDGGRLSLVDVLADGKVQANASFGSFPMASPPIPAGLSNAISADGSRIFWTALNSSDQPQALYVRENDTSPSATTVQADASQGGPESGGGMFWTASGDGSRVFFTDCRRLTGVSTAVPGGGCSHLGGEGGGQTTFTGNDLYEYELNPETGKTGVLRDLTVSTPGELALDEAGGDLLAANVQGVLGASNDGEYIYFAADGVLTTGQNTEGKEPTPGHPNLYLRHDGVTTFIATLSPQDGSDVQPLANCGQAAGCRGDWQAAPSYRTAEVTPDGHGLVFMSDRSLTGYDNEEAGKSVFEVFLYEAQSSAGSGKLSCVSCNPSGEPPVPTEISADQADKNADIGPVGAFFPTSEKLVEQTRVVSDDGGRVFFDSAEPLVPTDTNGWLDVYEWERDGTGTCTQARGCVYLLSGGTDPEDSYLIGTDTSGDNVFFVSRAAFVLADRGGDDDEVYDARVDGVQPPAVAACEGTGCQGVPPTPPIFATPSSVTFNGIGNFPPPPPAVLVKPKTKTVKCKKPKKLTHGKCLKPKKAKKAKRANRDRRLSR
jgi:DNA-binding beta-propeller fold protein YncE